MASLERDRKSGRYHIRFRHGGQAYRRSLKTSDCKLASRSLSRITETLWLLESGRLDMPPHADPATFIVSDGKSNGKISRPQIRTLDGMFSAYRRELPVGSKEPTTLACEQTHIGHLLRHLKSRRPPQSIDASVMQSYADARLKDQYRNQPIRPTTIKKEVATFRQIWNWAAERSYVEGPAPTRGIKYPKTEQKRPFMTWGEIERVVGRGGLTAIEENELWAALFLRRSEIDEILDHVGRTGRNAFVYPMFVFVAHTGARRSELQRSQIEDVDFAASIVRIREKKREQSKTITYRHVPMTGRLRLAMETWLANHPGGQRTLCSHNCALLTASMARDHFKRALSQSKWSKVRGFHVFRHSFASNLAAGGVDQRIIDEWMGHQSDEMRRRYRHLFPDQQQAAIELVFGGNGK